MESDLNSEIRIRGQGQLLLTGGRGPAGKMPFVSVCSLADLPSAIGGVITLLSGVAYYFCGDIDLLGSRLVTGENTCLLGSSSETSFITSTGINAGVPLLTMNYTCPVRHITFRDVDTCISIGGDGSAALDWTGVNFLNVPNIGVLGDCDNFIFTKGAFLNSQGLSVTGTIGTVSVDNSLLSGQGTSGAIISISSTANITRRFRIVYSSIIASGLTIAIDADPLATIGTDNYILDTVNFGGGGTYLNGILSDDNRSRFSGCIGIRNTDNLASLWMQDNLTPTVVARSTPTKAEGATSPSTINQRFSHSNNRLTYIGALSLSFKAEVQLSLSSGNNQELHVWIAKNGSPVLDSEMHVNTSGNGRTSSFGVQAIIDLSSSDYVELFVANDSSANNITVEQMNMIIQGI